MKLNQRDTEILTRDYPNTRVIRAEAERFPLVQRGSVRLGLGLYRTEDEQEEWICRGLKIRLPGQQPEVADSDSGFVPRLLRIFRRR